MFGASKTKQVSSGGYSVNNSLRLRRSASGRLNRTYSTNGTSRRIKTFSSWVKLGSLNTSAINNLMQGYDGSSSYSSSIFIDTNYQLNVGFGDGNYLITTQVFRDFSAWYHIVIAIDTTQATSSNRAKIYINGTQVTSFGTANYPTQNFDMMFCMGNGNNYVGASWDGNNTFDGYFSQTYLIDGQQLTPSSFGATDATTGVWQSTAYSGSYGTNGFYLPFSDIATTSGSNAGLGKDFSGNGNYWTTNNISVTSGVTYDAMVDSPTPASTTVANYCVWNGVALKGTVSDANLQTSVTTNGTPQSGTIYPTSGKFYWEVTMGSNNYPRLGITSPNGLNDSLGGTANGYCYLTDGRKYGNGVDTSYGVSATTNDIINFALDLDNGKLWFGKNGTWMASGDPAAGSNPSFSGFTTSSGWTPAVAHGFASGSDSFTLNCGQRGFAYTPPSGFKALNTYNLTTPAIAKCDSYFAPLLYTGNSAVYPTTHAITGLQFQPDFIWLKSRSNGLPNFLYDAVRGAGRYLLSEYTNAQTLSNQMTSFDSTGFTVANLADGSVGTNNNGSTFVSWNWKANGAGSSNTSGSITSTVSANQTTGVSIVTYTGNGSAGATVGHGLGAVPAMIIIKSTSIDGADWQVFHQKMNGGSSPWNYSMYLDGGSSQFSYAGLNNTSPTSSVFTLGSNGGVNQNGSTYVAYCFAEVNGFSSFGTYTGNGSNTDGPFVYTGFKPAYTMIKTYDNAGEWTIHDNQRPTYNQSAQYLFANVSDSEYNNIYNNIDYLSNGFKCRGTTGTNQNGNGYHYIVMSFAENPFKYSLAR